MQQITFYSTFLIFTFFIIPCGSISIPTSFLTLSSLTDRVSLCKGHTCSMVHVFSAVFFFTRAPERIKIFDLRPHTQWLTDLPVERNDSRRPIFSINAKQTYAVHLLLTLCMTPVYTYMALQVRKPRGYR